MDEKVISWWKSYFPDMPNEVIAYMKKQEDPDEGAVTCPWNRRQRRLHEQSKGVVINLFSGPSTWTSPTDLSMTCTAWEPGAIYALWHAVEGGGPPCRTAPRLRHKRPGPKPVRGRGGNRWRLAGAGMGM